MLNVLKPKRLYVKSNQEPRRRHGKDILVERIIDQNPEAGNLYNVINVNICSILERTVQTKRSRLMKGAMI